MTMVAATTEETTFKNIAAAGQANVYSVIPPNARVSAAVGEYLTVAPAAGTQA